MVCSRWRKESKDILIIAVVFLFERIIIAIGILRIPVIIESTLASGSVWTVKMRRVGGRRAPGHEE